MMRCFLLLTVLFSAVWGDTLENFGLGGAGVATAGAGSAFANDWTATYYNIAGLAFPGRLNIRNKKIKPKVRFRNSKRKIKVDKNGTITKAVVKKKLKQAEFRHDLGFAYLQQIPFMKVSLTKESKLAQKRADHATSKLSYGLIQTGFILDLRSIIKTPYDVPVKFGLVLSTSADGTVSKVPELGEEVYNFKRIGKNSQLITLLFGVGFQVWKNRLSVGISPGSSLQVRGEVEISNLSLDSEEPIELNTKINLKNKPAPVVAAQYRQPVNSNTDLFFSMVYRSEILLQSDLNVKTNLPLGFITELENFALRYVKPRIIGLGFGYRFKQYQLMLDVEHQGWSTFRLNPLRASYEEKLYFNDVVLFRIGGKADLNFGWFKSDWGNSLALKVRAGYAFIPSYTPDQTRSSNYLDNTKHLFGFGLSRIFGTSYIMKYQTTLDFGIQYQWWVERKTIKSTEGLHPNYSYGGEILITSLSLSWQF